MGVLYLVATPIGNLEDITLRALRVLREASLIASEDTRHSGRLLKHYGITTPQISFHTHSDPSRRAAILDALAQCDVALISDAGTPGISDPGFELVQEALTRGFTVTPIPGPSAITAAVPASGLVSEGFLYLGFLPRRNQERRALLANVVQLPYPLVIYEAPHRLVATLSDLEQELGDRPLVVARELTKLHEELRRTTVAEAQAHYAEHAPRGEFVLVVDSAHEEAAEIDEAGLAGMIRTRLERGESPSASARAIARETGKPRSEVYALTMRLKGEAARQGGDEASAN